MKGSDNFYCISFFCLPLIVPHPLPDTVTDDDSKHNKEHEPADTQRQRQNKPLFSRTVPARGTIVHVNFIV